MQWPGRVLLGLILTLSCLLPLQRASAAQDTVGTPELSAIALSPNDCAFLIQGSDDPRARLGDIACGTLDVPENWSQPEGRRLQIGYLVLKSTAAQPSPDPVVFLAGGPGSSPLTGAEVWSRFFAGLRQERDVIFFDQRGTRLSSPLRCEAYTKLMALVLPPDEDASAGTPITPLYAGDITNPDDLLQAARERYGPAGAECAQQLEAQGVDLAQYTSINSANDAVALVKALGYDEYNLYGISYGTRLALEVMRNHGASGLRSVVLDSTYPPEVKTYELLSISTHEVAMQLFADCQQDLACNAAYPDVKQRFISLLAQLRETPVIASDGTSISDRELINVMHSLTSRVEIAPYVPLLIDELERGDAETYLGIAIGSLFAAATTPDEASAGLPEISAARQFVLGLETDLASQEEQEAGTLSQALIELDALSHDRQTLRAFIENAIAESEHAEARARILTTIDAMSDAEVQEVFAVIEQTITLDDSKIAGQSVAQYYSIECNERMPFQSFTHTVENAQQLEIPDLALGKPEDLAKVFAICEKWPSGRAPDVEAEPVSSDIPTLILSGAYDNLTPISWNSSASRTLSNGTLLLVPMSGHAAITYSACAEQIGQEFIADPTVAPDTSCLTDLAPQWVMPAEEVSGGGQATP